MMKKISSLPPNILCIITMFTLASCQVNTKQEDTSERPNVILLMGDDHGWDETAYNGHPFLRTPVLDEMAATGLRMNRFYAATPICSPTRGSVITGRHPNRYGTFTPGFSIRPEEISIAQIMKNAVSIRPGRTPAINSLPMEVPDAMP